MRKLERDQSWVIYRAVNKGVVGGPNAVCGLAEWEAMERARPGCTVVVQSGVADEGVAERLARGTSGDPVPKAAKTPRPRPAPPVAAPAPPPWWAMPARR